MQPELRRRFLVRLGAGAAALLAAGRLAVAQRESPGATDEPAADLVTAETQRAIDRGLGYLAARQGDDGSLAPSGYGRNVAVAALSGLAFMSSGSMPGRGPYARNIERCLSFVLAGQDETGFISASDSVSHGPMYGHGFATLFLAEVYGMTPLSDVREKLARAVKVILESQNMEGGWRYFPRREDADISVTICQVMALRAARNAGVYVPNEPIERCVEYVKKCQNADGGFMYMLPAGESRFPRSAAGVAALYSAGKYDSDEVRKGLDYLMRNIPKDESYPADYYFYGHYYAVQVMWQAGGQRWRTWYPAIRDTLVRRQRADGSWSDDSISPEYSTAMAALILQMPNNYLPIFQR